MIYLKNLNGQVKEYKDSDTKTVNYLLKSNNWKRIVDRKDLTDYSTPKKKTKKKSK